MRKTILTLIALAVLALFIVSCKPGEIGPGKAIAGVQANWNPIYMHTASHHGVFNTIFGPAVQAHGGQRVFDESHFLGLLPDQPIASDMAAVKICVRTTRHKGSNYDDDVLRLNNCAPGEREKGTAGYAFTKATSGWPEGVSCHIYPDHISAGIWDHGAAMNTCKMGVKIGSLGYWPQLPQVTPPPAPTKPYPELVPWYECHHTHHGITNSVPQPNSDDCGRSQSEFIGFAAKKSGPGIKDTKICRRGQRYEHSSYYDNLVNIGPCPVGTEYVGEGPKLFENPITINNQLLTRKLDRCLWGSSVRHAFFNHDVSRYGCWDSRYNKWWTYEGPLGYVMMTDKWPAPLAPPPVTPKPIVKKPEAPYTCSGPVKDTLRMLQEDTYTVGDNRYDFKVIFVGEKGVKFLINGQVTDLIKQRTKYKFGDNLVIDVEKTDGRVKFCLNPITKEDPCADYIQEITELKRKITERKAKFDQKIVEIKEECERDSGKCPDIQKEVDALKKEVENYEKLLDSLKELLTK